MYLLAGLGNKGKKFIHTRHNVGFLVIDKIIKTYELKKDKDSFDCQIYKGFILKKKVILIKPMTFVNNSGKAISKIVSFYKIPLKNIFVIHDDMDLDLSRVKIKLGGSSAGHNGIKSIDLFIGKKYLRVRIGVGKPQQLIAIKDYVLQKFTKSELEIINKKINTLVENIEYLLDNNSNNLLNILSREK